MKYSFKGQTPDEMQDWLELANSDWSPTWNNFGGDPKKKTIEALLVEQGYVCAYCGRSIEASKCHIDHFWPRKFFDGTSDGDGVTRADLTLSYQNFFASCGPQKEKQGDKARLPSTCGDAKKAWFNEGNDIIPSSSVCESRFKYGFDGKIFPSNANDQLAKSIIEEFRLFDESLEYERGVITKYLEESIANGDIADIDMEIQIWKQKNGDKLKGFCQVAVRYLEDYQI
ncbi:retron system putative HNH endonuclease [Nitrospirillum pindoramense]|uniref:Uncharacterized protein (TIGR02646 family) n=1 Tax=Nitrospirillum amazonense TaxID=28077 RepID=A0A560HAD6_9PROT|nr:retron system putative HNH endonuclease [Nitrospirillum amazonense]TWB42584.1 uncharacterized protein (TIGR02646 family) [Nitrospirillum amazonense]